MLKYITYDIEGSLNMSMESTHDLGVKIVLDKNFIGNALSIGVRFRTRTLAPTFNIVTLAPSNDLVIRDRKSLEASNYILTGKLRLHANYIGHALLEPIAIELVEKGRTNVLPVVGYRKLGLPVNVVQDEGIWGNIFFVSVIILMVISYINLGAQLDEENLRLVVKRPMPLILGFLASVIIMPLISWFIGKWLFRNQTLYRIGSFVFACSPAASASSLWTVMLDSDKELSVGLQVISNAGAQFTMPLLLFAMEKGLQNEALAHPMSAVPYRRLLVSLFVLLVALLIGWLIVGRHEKAKKLSQRIFRPLVFSVLIFIVLFSSILYWHIYQMFDLYVLSAAALTTFLTYIISGLVGQLVSCDISKAIAVAISSAYKNSGITFGVLLVVFGAPDTYIAYVPCLAQIIITSISLYITYAIIRIIRCVRSPHGKDAVDGMEAGQSGETKSRKRRNSGSDAEKAAATASEENDEFIAMNVTDLDAELSTPTDKKRSIESNLSGEQTEVKTVHETVRLTTSGEEDNERPVSNI